MTKEERDAVQSRCASIDNIIISLEHEINLLRTHLDKLAKVCEDEPPIDIVRCKECKWCLVEDGGCERIGMVLFADEIENHFCGYGKRRE